MPTPDEPIPPYGVTAEAVFGLSPQTERQTDANNSRLQSPITEERVRGWIVDVSAEVAGRLGDYSSLTAEAQDRIRSSARTVVLNGAAHYMEAARYQTRAGVNETTYAGVLWTRYQTGLTQLADGVTLQLHPPDGPPGGKPRTGAYAEFPPARIPDVPVW